MKQNNDIPFELIKQVGSDHSSAQTSAELSKRRPPPALSNHHAHALYYRPSKELLQVINMALHSGSPLLLTGEPGAGKTQAADFIAAYFDIPLFKFLVKSTSTADDLKYEFDAVGYLHWAQSGEKLDETSTAEAVRKGYLHTRALWDAYEHDGEAVVLIDEIDKAPRDFPNDLLHELDQHEFPHPFDHKQMIRPQFIDADNPQLGRRLPIVIITSNEERRLPDAFLRRCLFHRIELNEALVRSAVDSMARASGAQGMGFPQLDDDLRAAAQQRFWEIRKLDLVEKKPSTAELLTWLCILSAQGVSAQELQDNRSLIELPGISALVKHREDLDRLR